MRLGAAALTVDACSSAGVGCGAAERQAGAESVLTAGFAAGAAHGSGWSAGEFVVRGRVVEGLPDFWGAVRFAEFGVLRLILMLLAVAVVAGAQPKAQLSGFVRDASSAVVEGAAISVLNLDTGVRRSAVSNSEGFYAVSSLTPGEYKVLVRKPGFATVAQTGIALHAMDVRGLDFTLQVGSLRDEVTVESTPSLMNFSDGSSGLVTTRAPAESYPVNGRALQGLIDLTPGVLITPATAGEAGQFSVNGQRPATNYFTVDGISANNGVSGAGVPGQFSGAALPAMSAIGSLHSLVSLGELDELKVLTSTYAPEYGRLPGAQVSISTRSGSNDVHGEVFSSVRNEALASTDWFANAAGIGKLPQRMVDSGGSVSGPVVRNRSFFLLSTEQIRLRQPAVSRVPVPPRRVTDVERAFPASGLAVMSNPASVGTTAARVDQAIGSMGTLFVRFNYAPSSNEFGYLQRTRSEFRSRSLTLGAVTAFSARITNDLRVGNSDTRVETAWLPGAANIDLTRRLPSPGTGQRLYALAVRGYGQILAGDSGESRQGLWNVADTVSFSAGRHDLRFGFDYQRLTPQRDVPIVSVAEVYDRFDGPPTLEFAQTGSGRSVIQTASLFAQDTWHVTSRLNVNYGARWEITPAHGLKTRFSQFAPRVGLAWRLDDRTVVRAGAGLFYDLGFSSAIDLINGAPFNRWRSGAGVAVVTSPEAVVEYGFAPNLRTPFTTQWNLTVERGLSKDSTVSAGYVGASGQRLLRREGSEGRVLATDQGRSNYHALQMQYRSRDLRGLQGTVSYTWAHAIDNGSWDSATYLLFPGGASDRGSANFDVRHSFQAALSYRLPRAWVLSGTFRARGGFPIDVITTDQPFGLGYDNNQRPDLVPGVPVWIDGRLNPAAFRVPRPGVQGSLGRNTIRGGGLAQLDVALQRSFVVTERVRLQFRAEAYNVTNTPAFADPVRVMSNPLFGISASMMNLMLGAGRPDSGLSPAFQNGGPRVFQLGVTLRF